MRRAEKAARHADLCRRSRLFSRCSRFGEKNRTDRARDQGYLFPIRPRNQKLLGKKLTISKQVRRGWVLPRSGGACGSGGVCAVQR